jgi:hypothetical protein
VKHDGPLSAWAILSIGWFKSKSTATGAIASPNAKTLVEARSVIPRLLRRLFIGEGSLYFMTLWGCFRPNSNDRPVCLHAMKTPGPGKPSKENPSSGLYHTALAGRNFFPGLGKNSRVHLL